jgi:hypothetical protein
MFAAVLLTVTAMATLAAWLVLARLFGVAGGVGTVEVLLLVIPALVIGLWIRRRAADAFGRRDEPSSRTDG